MNSIKTQAIITGIRSKQDRSLGLSVSTPELDIQAKALFLELQSLNVLLTITPLEEPEAPEYVVQGDLENKTPSERLRNVLYVTHQQLGIQEEFNTWYRNQMEKIIEHYKQKLV